jgi:membrane protein implicated in regulation of membrane protease activity
MLTNLATHYGWWLLALVLIGAEIIAPGFFMLWIGIAAAVMGLIVLIVPDLLFPMEVVLFVLLSLASCFLYWKFIRHVRDTITDQPLLNRRAEQYVGRKYILDSAIVNGHGKARVGDSLWMVEGPELPAGSPIEVVSVDGTTLKVRAAH